MAEITTIRHWVTTPPSFRDDVTSGLSKNPKQLPSKYFYDEHGAKLFEEICRLRSYYLTRSELGIMRSHIGLMAERLGPGLMLIEFGSGNAQKTRLLLSQLQDPIAYVPIDVAEAQLRRLTRELAFEYPSMEILPLCADFTQKIELPDPTGVPARKAVYFPGSTIGNFPPEEMGALLSHITDCCGFGGSALIGIDLKKNIKTIEAAYNDDDGVTARFNLNLLQRINRELAGTFHIDRFRHFARYNSRLGRIEMHLESTRRQSVSVDGQRFEFAQGETICTEYSYKYSVVEFADIAAAHGLWLGDYWTDAQRSFAILQFEVLG